MISQWTEQIKEYIEELSKIVMEMENVSHLRKQSLLTAEAEKISEVDVLEDDLLKQMQSTHKKRESILSEMNLAGIEVRSLIQYINIENSEGSTILREKLVELNRKIQLLYYSNLTNWVVTHRMSEHLTQMINVIVSGAKKETTYSDSDTKNSSYGSILDRKV